MSKVNWREIIVFYVIAVGVSAPFRLGWVSLESLLPLPVGLNSFYAVLRGIGPAVGFVTIFFLLKSNVQRKLSFFGRNKVSSLLAIVVIPVGLTVTGVANSAGLNIHYYGFVYGLVLVLYALGEEYGWRGYLQEALAPLKMVYRVIIIAVLWYVWHLNFLNPDVSLQAHLIHFLSLLLGSWGLLRITDITSSILFASAVHLSFNLFADVDGEFNSRLIILIVSIVLWIVLLRRYAHNRSVGQAGKETTGAE